MKRVSVPGLLFLAVVAIGIVCPSYTNAQQPDGARKDTKKESVQSIEPSDVFMLTLLVRNELELIRLEMGKPKCHRPRLEINNAAPHEVFFQALTLFRKTDRLCFEQIREHVETPEIPGGTVGPAEVYAVVQRVLTRLRNLKPRIGVAEKKEEPVHDPTTADERVSSAKAPSNQKWRDGSQGFLIKPL